MQADILVVGGLTAAQSGRPPRLGPCRPRHAGEHPGPFGMRPGGNSVDGAGGLVILVICSPQAACFSPGRADPDPSARQPLMHEGLFRSLRTIGRSYG